MYRLTTEKSGILGYGRMENVPWIFGQFYILGMRAICHDIANSLKMFLNIVILFASKSLAPDELPFALQILFIIFVATVTKKLRMFRMRVKNDHCSKFSNLSNWKEEA